MNFTRFLFLILAFNTLNLIGCTSKPVTPEAGPLATGTEKGQPGTKKVDPKALAAFKRALTELQQGNSDEALVLFQEMTGNYPQIAVSHTNIGLIYFRANDFELAENAFQQAIKIKPDNAIAYNHLGIIYRKKGRFSDAEQQYLKAIEAKADYANAHLNLGILYDIYLRKLNLAIQHYEKYQTLQPEEDKTVKKWIAGLKRRQKASK